MWIKEYAKILWLSLSSSDFYAQLSQIPLSLSIKFFLLSFLFFGLSSAAQFQVRDWPVFLAHLNETKASISTYYPDDLSIVWDGQNLWSSITYPLAIQYPSFWQPGETWPVNLAYLLSYNPDITTVAQTLPSSSFAVITTESLHVSDLNGGWTTFPLRDLLMDLPSTEVKKSNVSLQLEALSVALEPFLEFIKRAAWVVIPVLLLLDRSIMLLVQGVLAYFLIKLIAPKLTSSTMLKMTLHIGVVAELLTQLTGWLQLETSLPMFMLAFWGYISYLLLRLKRVVLQ
ncbi:MAG: hypothetical protein M3Q81_03950 [bacterium]|nr:hypothetical protein [bacterium]